MFHCVHFECPATSEVKFDMDVKVPRSPQMAGPSGQQGAAAGMPGNQDRGPPQGLGPIPDDNGNPQDAADMR